MSKLKTSYNSRYNYNEVIDDGYGNQTLETFSFPEVDYENESVTDFVVTSEFENRLDKVSSKFYGSPLYWWIIAIYNNIFNPLQVRAGTHLLIPSSSFVYTYADSKNSN